MFNLFIWCAIGAFIFALLSYFAAIFYHSIGTNVQEYKHKSEMATGTEFGIIYYASHKYADRSVARIGLHSCEHELVHLNVKIFLTMFYWEYVFIR